MIEQEKVYLSFEDTLRNNEIFIPVSTFSKDIYLLRASAWKTCLSGKTKL